MIGILHSITCMYSILMILRLNGFFLRSSLTSNFNFYKYSSWISCPKQFIHGIKIQFWDTQTLLEIRGVGQQQFNVGDRSLMPSLLYAVFSSIIRRKAFTLNQGMKP